MVTSTATDPRTPAGATQRASTDDSTSAIIAADDPNLHPVLPATKPLPATVTIVPPVTTPDDGITDDTEPTAAYSI